MEKRRDFERAQKVEVGPSLARAWGGNGLIQDTSRRPAQKPLPSAVRRELQEPQESHQRMMKQAAPIKPKALPCVTCESLTAECASVHERNAILTKQNSELMEQLTQAMNTTKALKRTATTLQREKNALAAKVDSTAPQFQPLQREIDRFKSENEKLRKDIGDMQSQAHQLSAANSRMQTNCEALRRENEEIALQHSELVNERRRATPPSPQMLKEEVIRHVQACTGDMTALIQRLTKELKQSYEEYDALALECGAAQP
jgi:chromosome segregation ATPase